MKYGIRFLIFLMAFQLEVRVRAAAEYIEQPARCLQSQEACSIQSVGEAFHLEQNSLKLHAQPGSLLVRHSLQNWRLVKGVMWIERADDIEVETLYGNIRSSKGGFWILDQGDQVLVRNIGAQVEVRLRDGKALSLPEGFQFWMKGLNSAGVSEYGMLEPIDVADHLVRWNSLYRGSKESFVKEAQLLKQQWPLWVEKGSLIYQSLAERNIASVFEKRKQEKASQVRLIEERRRMKQLFHERVFQR